MTSERVDTLLEVRAAIQLLPKMNVNNSPVQTVEFQMPLYVINRDQALDALDTLLREATTNQEN